MNHIIKLSRRTQLVKMNFKSVLGLLPVNPSKCHHLAMEWNKGITQTPTSEVCSQAIQHSGRPNLTDTRSEVCITNHSLS